MPAQGGHSLRVCKDSAQLTSLSCMFCNLAGPLPVFLGSLPSLQSLKLSGNNLSGKIPVSFKGGMSLQNLWLNDQNGGGLSGTIDVVTTMDSVNVLWLHGNQFTGTIPESIGNLTVLRDLNLNSNQLVGFVPDSLAKMSLQHLDLNNNQLMGPIPKFKATEVSYTSNAFCQSTPGVPCAPEVMALLEFLGSLNYPSRLVSSWTGNNPCLWLGLACDPDNKVNSIALPNHNLSGSLSPSVAKLGSLFQVKLAGNNIIGPIPDNWTSLTSLKTLDLSANNISPPLPKFSGTVNVVISGNPLFNGGSPSNPTPFARQQSIIREFRYSAQQFPITKQRHRFQSHEFFWNNKTQNVCFSCSYSPCCRCCSYCYSGNSSIHLLLQEEERYLPGSKFPRHSSKRSIRFRQHS
ncbi:hypothetical protein OIU77_017719 [Salix suchowensis]|uniref:Leucine-rich repeat-containing N-terminal plant-type domain-containing protein n=1 Tax=Salix suchowensis TaxID=1278906 RepID=A0ABQ8ZQB4_9ROSI|nr:hypothetical protein OIU77_017719 [Salix suchowensis]